MENFSFNYDSNSNQTGWIIMFPLKDDLIGFQILWTHVWYLLFKKDILDMKNEWKYKIKKNWLIVQFRHHSMNYFFQSKFVWRSAHKMFSTKVQNLLLTNSKKIILHDEILDVNGFSCIVKSLQWIFRRNKLDEKQFPFIKLVIELHKKIIMSPFDRRTNVRSSFSVWNHVYWIYWNISKDTYRAWYQLEESCVYCFTFIQLFPKLMSNLGLLSELVNVVLDYCLWLKWPHEFLLWLDWHKLTNFEIGSSN